MPFVAGQSGNPSGRPKENPILKEMARARTADAFEVVLACLNDDDAKVRLKAAEIVLDRGHGRPSQAVTVAGDEDGGAIRHSVEVALVGKTD
jgi:hypothetical protein